MNELLYFLDDNFWWALIISFFVALFFYYCVKTIMSENDKITISETYTEEQKKLYREHNSRVDLLNKMKEEKNKETERLIKEGKISAKRVKFGNAISKGGRIGCGCMIWIVFILSSIIFILTLVTITFDSAIGIHTSSPF